MTWKTNPGCSLPDIKTPPGIQDLYTSIAQEYATQKAALLLSPTVVVAQRKIAAAQSFADKAAKQAEQLQKYTDLVAEYAGLLDTCPCALVWDDEAANIDVS